MKTDGLMAQVEIVVNEPMRLVAVVTRDAVEELALDARDGDDRDREIDQRDRSRAEEGLGAEPQPRLVIAVVVAALGLAVLGGANATSQAQITVYAAASLTDVFPKIDSAEKYSFGGSNTLAAQITAGRAGGRLRFREHDAAEPAEREGTLLEAGRVHAQHARDRGPEVEPGRHPRHLRPREERGQARHRGPGVPVGSYTLQILKNMSLSAAVLKNVVSQETDVREVLAKVALGEADAGFVYSTDAKTVAGQVTVLKVPAWAQPKVQYGICVVSSSANKADAQAFVNKVLSKAGQAKLLAAGFLPRVKPKPRRRSSPACGGQRSRSRASRVAVVTLAFLLLPIVAIFVHTSPGQPARPALEPGREGRVRREREDERDRAVR